MGSPLVPCKYFLGPAGSNGSKVEALSMHSLRNITDQGEGWLLGCSDHQTQYDQMQTGSLECVDRLDEMNSTRPEPDKDQGQHSR